VVKQVVKVAEHNDHHDLANDRGMTWDTGTLSLSFPLPPTIILPSPLHGDRFHLLDARRGKAQRQHRLVPVQGSQGPQGTTPNAEEQGPPRTRLLCPSLCAPAFPSARLNVWAHCTADNHKPASIDSAKSGTLEVNPGREVTSVRVERPTVTVRFLLAPSSCPAHVDEHINMYRTTR